MAALIEACTSALGGGRCALTQARNSESVTAIAIVSWRDGQRLGALVEVGWLHEPAELWRSEELEFKSGDQRLERFRTLGLAIAALSREASPELSGRVAGGREPAAPAQNQAASPAPAAASRSSPKGKGTGGSSAKPSHNDAPQGSSGNAPTAAEHDSRPVPHQAEAWVSSGALAFYDPKLPGWRVGEQLEVGLGTTAFPGFVNGFASYAVGRDSASVALSWSTVGLGPGLRVPLTSSLELRGTAQGLLVSVSGRASQGGQTSRQSVWVPGAAFCLELKLRASDRLSGTLSGQLQRLAGNVPLREHDQLIGTVGKAAVGITLSLELRLFGPVSTRR